MFFSTRNKALRVSSSVALLEGISPDGGLFLPEPLPRPVALPIWLLPVSMKHCRRTET